MTLKGALAAMTGLALTACAGEAGKTREPATLAAGTGEAARLAAACSGCHAGPGAEIASLEGRSAGDIRAMLGAYKSERGGTTVMHRLSRGYTDTEIEAVSAYLATQAEGG